MVDTHPPKANQLLWITEEATAIAEKTIPAMRETNLSVCACSRFIGV